MKRTLGAGGVEVSALGMGCWAIGGPFRMGALEAGWGMVDDRESVRAIEAAIEAGMTLFDTAANYGAGHSERVLGRAVAENRAAVVLATKFGYAVDEAEKLVGGVEAGPEAVRRSCEASLQRLGTDYLDLFQFHVGDFPTDEVDDILETLEALVAEGKIRAYGWSTDDPERAGRFAAGAHCVSVQHQLNVLEDNPAMLALCERAGLASINRGPLAMGLLTGKFSAGADFGATDVRQSGAAWLQYFRDGQPNPAWLARLEAVREVLTSNGRTLAQGALAWLWARSPATIPIPGFRTVNQVEENAGALAYGSLTGGQMAEIEQLLGR